MFEGGKTAKSVNRIMDGMKSWLFDYVQPGMKVSFAYDTFNKILPKYLKKYSPKTSLEQARAEIESGEVKTDGIVRAARDAVKAADGHFSHEHWKRSLLEANRFTVKYYFDPVARKYWQRALLSPTWQREHLLVAKNVAKSFMPDKMIKRLGMEEIGPIKSEYRRYMLGALMMVSTIDLYNLMMTKKMDGKAKHIWENPPGKFFGVRAPWNTPDYTITDKDGKERTVRGGPAYIRPLKSIYEVAEWTADPVRKLRYKLSPFLTGIGRQMFPSKYQKDYTGLLDPQRLIDFSLDVATPISVDQAMDVLKGKKSAKGAVLPFLGFPVSKVSRYAELDKLINEALTGKGTHAKVVAYINRAKGLDQKEFRERYKRRVKAWHSGQRSKKKKESGASNELSQPLGL
jgi:hypothetical protein